MRQKSIEELAQALAQTRPSTEDYASYRQWLRDVYATARAAGKRNIRFKYRLFYNMCGVQEYDASSKDQHYGKQ